MSKKRKEKDEVLGIELERALKPACEEGLIATTQISKVQ